MSAMSGMVTGVILAGGKSTRLPPDKALMPVDGKRLIEHVAGVLGDACDNVIMVTDRPEAYSFLGLPAVADRYPGRGPLAGIHAALKVAPTPFVFVSACDMPFISVDLIRFSVSVAAGYDAVVPYPDGERPEPAHALYGQTCLPHVERCLRAGQTKVFSFFAQVAVRRLERPEIERFGPPEAIFLNVNTSFDLARARTLVAGRAVGPVGRTAALGGGDDSGNPLTEVGA